MITMAWDQVPGRGPGLPAEKVRHQQEDRL
jgi:hypothetical protein